MRYVSTRGHAPALGFEDVLLAGLARDGGLYVPEVWPRLSFGAIEGFAGRAYQDVATEVMLPFMEGEVAEPELRSIVAEAYATFEHKAVAPLVQIDARHWILELFHGPTFAFKDVAMQVLARLMERTLKRRGQSVTIVGATSGDTGGAAVDAFRGRDGIDLFILFPEGRVSDVQRRQMTTAPDRNVHVLAIDGTFDDCQALVKGLFNDQAFRDRRRLAGVNSINWARLMAQIVYYFTSAVALGAPGRCIGFAVPTGNFGDVFAGYAAGRMGLPIDRLVVATNINDILVRTLETGRYERKPVFATASPSMDIQISSNFERLLFELSGRNPERVREHMHQLQQHGSFVLSPEEHAAFRQTFDAVRVDEAETAAEMRRLLAQAGYAADPHTAVGSAAAVKIGAGCDRTLISLATAHPAKFPEAVTEATGRPPPMPASLTAQFRLRERFHRLPNNLALLTQFIDDVVQPEMPQ